MLMEVDALCGGHAAAVPSRTAPLLKAPGVAGRDRGVRAARRCQRERWLAVRLVNTDRTINTTPFRARRQA
jgi:hypothetical protein